MAHLFGKEKQPKDNVLGHGYSWDIRDPDVGISRTKTLRKLGKIRSGKAKAHKHKQFFPVTARVGKAHSKNSEFGTPMI